MQQNAHFLAKIGADTAENEQHFAEILPTDARRRPALSTATPRAARGKGPSGGARGRPPPRGSVAPCCVEVNFAEN